MFIQLLLYDGYSWEFSLQGWHLIVSTAEGGPCRSLFIVQLKGKAEVLFDKATTKANHGDRIQDS